MNRVKEVLQKINFIEMDMELHKQILVSIPPDHQTEMETIVGKIADLKHQIHELRLEIKHLDEKEYDRILAIEQATKTFCQMAREKNFVRVNTLNETGVCFVTLNDGTRMDCLVTAKEENGNWTVLTLEGELKEYPHGLMKQEGTW